MAELLPCPFCGGEAGLFEVKGIGNDLLGYTVGCTEAHCEIRPSITKDLDKEGVIKAWNTRTPKERGADNG
jgi:hypothetical protein